METITSNGGLCSNCAYAPACTYPRSNDRPVLQCEEYECSPSGVVPASPAKGSSKARSGRKPGGQVTVHLAGLCANCANQDGCTFPKQEGGVWHCEEYQ